MDQNYSKMFKAGRRLHNVLFFSRHDGINPQEAKKKNKLQNTHQQRDKWCKIFLSPLTAKVMQKSTVQKDRIALEKYKNIAQNVPQNTLKWLPEEGEMLWKGLSSDAPLRLIPAASAKKLMWSNWMVLQKKRSIKK